MKCIGYDVEFQRTLAEKFAVWDPPPRRTRQKKTDGGGKKGKVKKEEESQVY